MTKVPAAPVRRLLERTLGYEDIPGPRTFPLIGNVLGYKAPEVGRTPSQSLRIWSHLNKCHGPLVRLDIPGRERTVLVFDPWVAEQVYRQEGRDPSRPAFYSLRAVKRRDGEGEEVEGMLTSNGSHWRTARRCAQAALLQPNIARRYLPSIWNISNQFADHIEGIVNSGDVETQMKFEEEAYKWALESIASIALNKRLGCISSQPDQECLLMIKSVSEILHYSKKLDGGLRLWEKFPSKDFDHFYQTYRTFKSLAQSHIKESFHKEDGGESLVSNLKMSGHSTEMITTLATELMFGGVDTTSHSVIFSLYLLANNKDHQQRLREELDSVRPERVDKDLLSLPYLKSVIKESMRMLPTSPANIRQLQSPVSLTTSQSGLTYQLSPGTTFILCHQTMSNSQTWVTQPDLFRPDRWTETNSKINPFISLPFGFGPRMCIGKRISWMEISSLIAALIRRFEVGWDGPEMSVKTEILVFPDTPLRFTFRKRV